MRRALVLVSLAAAACIGRDDPPVGWPASPNDTTQGAWSASVVESIAQAARHLEPGSLGTVTAVPVQGFTGPGGLPFEVAQRTAEPPAAHGRPFGTTTLSIVLRLRAPDLVQYPCSSCHMGRGMVLRDERVPDAHPEIRPVHPSSMGAMCSTCHAAENIALLTLQSGERVEMDHAYRLCAQCHFSQAEGWAGGAHGKRLDGWQGRRVVMNCADCHDPHNPAAEPRLPFRAPTIVRPSRRDP